MERLLVGVFDGKAEVDVAFRFEIEGRHHVEHVIGVLCHRERICVIETKEEFWTRMDSATILPICDGRRCFFAPQTGVSLSGHTHTGTLSKNQMKQIISNMIVKTSLDSVPKSPPFEVIDGDVLRALNLGKVNDTTYGFYRSPEIVLPVQRKIIDTIENSADTHVFVVKGKRCAQLCSAHIDRVVAAFTRSVWWP